MIEPAADDSDGALAGRCLAGDPRAFPAIVQRHKAALYRVALRLTGDAEDSLDIVQESFVAAHGALRRYDPARPMRGWLMRIAVNKARDWRRRRFVRRMLAGVLPLDHAADAADDAPSPEVAAADRQELRRVRAAVEALPAALREVLLLRTVEGLSQAETADALGIGAKAVETRLYRARQRLAERLGIAE